MKNPTNYNRPDVAYHVETECPQHYVWSRHHRCLDIGTAKTWCHVGNDNDVSNSNWRIRETRNGKTVAFYTPTSKGFVVDFPRI